MAIPMLIETLIGDKACLGDLSMLPHCDHCELLDIQIDGYRDQIRITLTFNDLAGLDRLALEEMNASLVLPQDELGAIRLPSCFGSTPLKVAVIAGGIMNPLPLQTSTDLESDKALPQVQRVEFQGKGPCVECGVIDSRRNPGLALLLAGT